MVIEINYKPTCDTTWTPPSPELEREYSVYLPAHFWTDLNGDPLTLTAF